MLEELWEYRIKNLRALLSTESIKILQDLPTCFQWGLGQGNGMATSEAWFCDNFCIWMYILDHFTAGKSNYKPGIVSCPWQPDVNFKFWFFMGSVMARTLTRCTRPLEEKQLYSITDPPPYPAMGIRLFSILLFMPNQHWVFVAKKHHFSHIFGVRLSQSNIDISLGFWNPSLPWVPIVLELYHMKLSSLFFSDLCLSRCFSHLNMYVAGLVSVRKGMPR